MTTGEPSLKRLRSLLRRLKGKYPLPPSVEPSSPVLGADGVLTELLTGMLLWDATTTQARHAMKRLHDHLVDLNELRVCVAEEIADILGEKYPFAMERSLRLRFLLGDIYQREHAVQLSHLEALGKREARAYLESLEGVPHFAAARTFAFALGGHAVPVDDRLRALLVAENVVKDAATCAALSSWLERSIGADDVRESLHALQAWADEEGQPPKREPVGIEPAPPARVPSKTSPAKVEAATEAKAKAKGARAVAKKPKAPASAKVKGANPPKPARKAAPGKDSKA